MSTHTDTSRASELHRPRAAMMKTAEAAHYLGLAVSTLNKWRCDGDGPKFLKLGRAVRYRREDLDAFVMARQLGSTADD